MDKVKNPYSMDVSRYSTQSAIVRVIGKNKSVLDVGCNEGYLGEHSDDSNHFFGIDYMESAVAIAKTRYEDAVVYDLNTSLDLPWDRRYDVIVFADVLEHVLFPEVVLRFFVKKYLEKNGTVIISLPNIGNWRIRASLLFGRFEYSETGILDRTHLHLYTFRAGHQLVESCGLELENEFCGASFFGPFIKLFPILSRLLSTNMILVCRNQK